MKKQYHFTGLGQRIILDWRLKRSESMEKLLEQQKDNEGTGKKLDFLAGLLLVWVLVLVFLNQYFSIYNALFLSLLGPLAFSKIYQLEHLRKKRIIAKMKKERERKAICLANLQSLQPEDTDRLAIQLGQMLELANFKGLGRGLPVLGLKDGKKVAVYVYSCPPDQKVNTRQMLEFVELVKEQGAIAGIYFTTGSFAPVAERVVKNLNGWKVKLIDQEKFIKVLKDMNHPFYLNKLADQNKEEIITITETAVGEKKRLLALFTERPALAKQYIFISIVLGLLLLTVTGWMRIVYMVLAFVNLSLAIYTYFRHLPVPEEEKIVLDDLW